MIYVRDYSWDYTMIRKSLLINTALAMITMIIMMIIMLTMKLMMITLLMLIMIASLFCLSLSDLTISLFLYCY